ncbi:uncharacterized protein LOC141599661 [Silene latifolia]|uniref:uncharacterized protein LOC141599661 n=1 Tax=Silene latifolia TaxID=37657 RepID=UPI003D77BCF3
MVLVSLQMMNCTGLSAFRSSRVVLELDSEFHGKGNLCLRQQRRGFGVSNGGRRRRLCNENRVCCKLQDGDDTSNNNNGEAPESLFMKELRKRGISSTSLLEEIDRDTIEEEMIQERGDRPFSKRDSITTGFDKSLTNQREQSMALNSEGLEGLIPRAKLLLRLGGTFFLAFWPLILLTIASTAALYLYFGRTFIHDGTDPPISPPQYIDLYVLLEEERIIR